MRKKAVLVISFGTSYNESRNKTIGAIEKEMEERFADRDFYRAYTSRVIIRILRNRDGIAVDTVEEAFEKLVRGGYESVLVQPTHVINGMENEEMTKTLGVYAPQFKSLCCGRPLLDAAEDYEKLSRVLAEELKNVDKPDTAMVFMGHGTEHQANQVYGRLDETLNEMGHCNYLIGTVEADPGLGEILEKVKARGYKKAVLLPLMIVAGDHAYNDMAGETEDSWKSTFEREGISVRCILKGMGEYKGVRELFVEHAKEAVSVTDKIF